jgi:hypothetical protein
MTPAGGLSGINTPFTSHSRSPSADNLAPATAELPSEFATGVFHRLHGLANRSSQWLQDRARITSAPDASLNDGGEGSSRGGNPLRLATNALPAGDASGGTPTHATSQHIEFSTEALSKVPSYNTARQSRAAPLVNDGLPNYQSAISVPIVPSIVPPTPGEAHSGGNQQDVPIVPSIVPPTPGEARSGVIQQEPAP